MTDESGVKMGLEDAFAKLSELAVDGEGRAAVESVRRAVETYRMMYEAAERRLTMFREVSSMAALSGGERNKDMFQDIGSATEAYGEDGSGLTFGEWLYERARG